MKKEDIEKRLDDLLNQQPGQNRFGAAHGKFEGALSIMVILYGPKSVQVENFLREAEAIRPRVRFEQGETDLLNLANGALRNMKAELEAGVVDSLQKTITGEVLADFLQLARTTFDERGDGAKNVSAVLAAALFEDTIRRISSSSGASHIEKLQDVITDLKDRGVLKGSQVGIANSYLNFRNNALHAQWDKVERESVASVLGFVEQLLVKHFS